MKELESTFESLGFSGVKTYIRSGNVIFHSVGNDKSELKGMIEEKVSYMSGFPVIVILRTINEMLSIINSNPFLENNRIDPNELHTTFLSEIPTETNGLLHSVNRKYKKSDIPMIV